MDLEKIQDELDELRPEDYDADAVKTLVAKVGQMAEGDIRSDEAEAVLGVEQVDDMHSSMFAGTLLALIEYAHENDIDMVEAVQHRLEQMEKMKSKRDEIDEAVESGDAEALAEALRAQANEVPTGMFEEGEDEDDPRGFY